MSVPRSLKDGRYTVTRLLGTGGMAEVHECYDQALQVWRAVKFLLPEYARKRKIRDRFDSEAHAMAKVEHRAVVRIYDVGEEEGRPFMIMELATGGSLESYVARHGKMDPRLATQVMLEVCEGVHAAHLDGIIHRDLKPDNVLITRRGEAKVTDFGIAQLNDSTDRTRTGSVMGTLGFMAPEQKTDAKNISPSVDVYSLGATLWSLVTGDLPGDLFMAHHEPAILENVPEALKPPLLGALTFRQSDRYADVPAFAAALREALTLLPPTSKDAPSLITAAWETGVPPAPIQTVRESVASLDTINPEDALSDSPQLLDEAETPEPGPGEEKRPGLEKLPYRMPAVGERVANPSYVVEHSEDRDARKQAALKRLEALRGRSGSTEITDGSSSGKRSPLDRVRAAQTRGTRSDRTSGDSDGPGPEHAFAVAAGASTAHRPATPATPAGGTEARRPPTSRPSGEVPVASPAKPDVLIETAKDATQMSREFAGESVNLVMEFALAPLKPMIIPLVGVILILVFTLGMGAWRVRGAAYDARAAEANYLATIESEDRIIEDLKAIGAQGTLLDINYTNFKTAQGPDKLERSTVYVGSLHEQMQRYASSPPAHALHRAEMARTRIRRIDSALLDYQDKMLAWEEAADATQGRMACSVGLASCPE